MKTRIKVLLALAVFGVLAAVALSIFHNRPLIRTSSWVATIQAADGEIVQGEVFKMLGDENKLFVRFPEPIPGDQPGYPWFSTELGRKLVAIPNRPRQQPYLHFNHDMALGVGLTDGKVGSDWSVSWTEGGFVAQDSYRKVILSRGGSVLEHSEWPNKTQHHKSDRAGGSEA